METLRTPTFNARFSLAFAALLFLSSAGTAYAYAGLGPLIPMVGNALTVLFVFAMTFLGIVTYPIKVAIEKMRKPKKHKRTTVKKHG